MTSLLFVKDSSSLPMRFSVSWLTNQNDDCYKQEQIKMVSNQTFSLNEDDIDLDFFVEEFESLIFFEQNRISTNIYK